MIIPYALSETSGGAPPEKTSTSFFGSLALGYTRVNEKWDVLPEKDRGRLLVDWRLKYDPSRFSGRNSMILTPASYIDTNFSITINDREGGNLNKLNDPFFNVDIIMYGRHSQKGSPENGIRNLYGFFTGIEYQRPYLEDPSVRWTDSIYPDYVHIQYCYWETLLFRQILEFARREGSVTLTWSAGIGPGQNSSLTATDIEDEDTLSQAFTNKWYGRKGFEINALNYYYSLVLPAEIELSVDRYINSRFDLRYRFFYFQAFLDSKLYDIMNVISFKYSYYFNTRTTVGAGYDFYHIMGFSAIREISHHWHRFTIQGEIRF